MGKIVYYSSVLNSCEAVEYKRSSTVLDFLKELSIENDSLCVILNGECPDDFDVNYEIKDTDLIEIRRIVEGGGAQSKKNLAMVVQIAAIVGATVLSGGGYAVAAAAVAVSGSLVSGALNAKAAKMLAQQGQKDVEETKTATNAYSLNSISNEARPLQPLPLLMGTHRFAPDIHAQAIRDFFGIQNTSALTNPVLNQFRPSGSYDFGVKDPNNGSIRWPIMPANYIASGFPQYDIAIAPFSWGFTNPLTNEQKQQVIDDVKASYLSGFYSNPSYISWTGYDAAPAYYPLVIAHISSSDPYRWRGNAQTGNISIDRHTAFYNFFWAIARVYEMRNDPIFPNLTYSDMDILYNMSGSNTDSLEFRGMGSSYQVYVGAMFYNSNTRPWISAASSTTQSKTYLKTQSSPSANYPFTIGNSDTVHQVVTKMGNLIKSLNGWNGSFYSGWNLSYPIEYQQKKSIITGVLKEGFEYSTQVFNYGLGDLDISDRKVDARNLDNNYMSTDYRFIDLSTSPPEDQYKIPDIVVTDSPYFFNSIFFTETNVVENKELININHTTTPISPSDNGQYNFCYFAGGKAHNECTMYVSGYLYATNTSTGFESNTVDIEIQYRLNTDDVWKSLAVDNSSLTIQNNNTKKLTVAYKLLFDPISEKQYYEFRVRKLTLDSVNNDNNKTCKLSVVNFSTKVFYLDGNTLHDKFRLNRAPMNLEGLHVTATVSDAKQSNRYNALVKSKCWVYDFLTSTWTWTTTSNPAFWFLYFAQGGFKNLDSDGTFTYPYSPTIGWQNYPNHEGNSERIFGCGLTHSEIDIDKILEWAQFCDDNDLTFNLILKDDQSCAETLEKIANVGRGSVTYYNGLLSIVYEDPESISTCMFGMANIIAGSFSVEYLVSNQVRKVVGNFVNEETWESESVEAIVPFSSDENIDKVEVSLDGITNIEQAQREVNLLAARQFYQRRTYSWSVDIEGLLVKRGNLAYLSHDCTQYGYAGRVLDFIMEAGVITGIKTSAIIEDTIEYITLRCPDGSMQYYECHLENDVIVFDELYPLEKASWYYNNKEENLDSEFYRSQPDDFIFIAGEMETGGKLVRISQIQSGEDMTFNLTAVDEDPAMWAYEYDNVIPSESFDDSELVLKIKNIDIRYLENGLVKILFETINCDSVQIVNLDTGLPIESQGKYTYANGIAVIELIPNTKYNLEIRPYIIGSAYRAVNEKVVVWPI